MTDTHPCQTLASCVRLNLTDTITIMDKAIEILHEDLKIVRDRNQGSENTGADDFSLIGKLNVDIETFNEVRDRLDQAKNIFAARTMFVHVREYPPVEMPGIIQSSSLLSRQ